MSVTAENLRFVLGLKLRALRLKRHLSLKNVAESAGLAISYLSEIEKGKKYPKPEKLLDLARALEVPFDDLVSLRVDEDLSQLKAFAGSGFLKEFPFRLFGLEAEDLFELVSGDPARAGALIRTFVEVGQRYDLSVEHFLFAALRSYQQLHANYFPDLEEAAVQCRAEVGFAAGEPPDVAALRAVLARRWGYRFDEESLVRQPELAGLRSVLMRDEPPLLAVNGRLLPAQKAFILAREIGYRFLGLTVRARTSSWLKVESFEQLLNNFKASYFAGALLMDRERMLTDLTDLLGRERWDAETLSRAVARYRATPEMLFYRVTELAPSCLGLKEIFFLRFSHDVAAGRFELTKVLNLSRVPVPHGVGYEEHYCRRWLPLTLLEKLARAPATRETGQLAIGAERHRFLSVDEEFLLVGAARPLALARGVNSSVSLGFLVDDAFRAAVRFADDPALPRREVDLTCERCLLAPAACAERAAPPTIVRRQQAAARRESALAALLAGGSAARVSMATRNSAPPPGVDLEERQGTDDP